MTKVVEYDIHVTDLNSTAISDVWYAGKTQELYVKFKGTGNIAGYRGVAPHNAKALLEAQSVGQYYTRQIKPKFGGISGDVTFQKYKETVPTVKDVLAEKKRFRVTGNVLKPVTVDEYVYATSLEDAMAEFRKKYSGKEPEVTGVSLYTGQTYR